ncbi:hypothetical protein [Cycloclasticus pugetii]|uniref:hypothetical protein n=1 Tax=Cycloclasticus pugetii TaxID=34068 RepID=UPI000920CDF7|nr:hypothetical protein [Cycloclasticus pugetii]SHJ32052.1 hypothetical protein SAMN05519226_1850 [Cycloclasticus pugetii]
MKFLDKFKRKSAASRLLEEQLYSEVVQELAEGTLRNGLWGQALEKANGDEIKAKSLYIPLRVQSMKDEAEIYQAIEEEAEVVRQVKLADPATKARSFGLTEDEIAYLGTPIEAVRYIEKYKSSQDKLSKAINQRKILGVVSHGALWVQDKKYS